MTPPSFHSRLRALTRAEHESLDGTLSALDLQRPADYAAFLRIHDEALGRLQPLWRADDEQDFSALRRSVRADLQALRATAAPAAAAPAPAVSAVSAVPAAPAAPGAPAPAASVASVTDAQGGAAPRASSTLSPIAGDGQRWGVAYVVRGSRLGAKLLRRRVPPGVATQYLDRALVLGWPDFVNQLDAHVGTGGPVAQAEVVSGARLAFGVFAACAFRTGR